MDNRTTRPFHPQEHSEEFQESLRQIPVGLRWLLSHIMTLMTLHDGWDEHGGDADNIGSNREAVGKSVAGEGGVGVGGGEKKRKEGEAVLAACERELCWCRGSSHVCWSRG